MQWNRVEKRRRSRDDGREPGESRERMDRKLNAADRYSVDRALPAIPDLTTPERIPSCLGPENPPIRWPDFPRSGAPRRRLPGNLSSEAAGHDCVCRVSIALFAVQRPAPRTIASDCRITRREHRSLCISRDAVSSSPAAGPCGTPATDDQITAEWRSSNPDSRLNRRRFVSLAAESLPSPSARTPTTLQPVRCIARAGATVAL